MEMLDGRLNRSEELGALRAASSIVDGLLISTVFWLLLAVLVMA